MNGRKFLLLGVSVILVVGVLIGLIVGINHGKSKQNDQDKNALSTASKAVASVCSQTDYKKACVDSMKSVANNQSATPKDFLQAAINVAIKEVEAAMGRPADIGKSANDPQQKMAVEDCKDLLQYAVSELQASFSMVGDNDMHSISDREAELKNWLSAVISYQQTCVDGFTTPQLRDAISNGLLNATQLTDNALAIVTAISQIFQAFNIPLKTSPSHPTSTSRRLLENGFPAWFPSADRKLLASQSGGQPRPNAVVAQDGSGQFKTINGALAAYPKNLNGGRYIIYVKAGIYDEYITC